MQARLAADRWKTALGGREGLSHLQHRCVRRPVGFVNDGLGVLVTLLVRVRVAENCVSNKLSGLGQFAEVGRDGARGRLSVQR